MLRWPLGQVTGPVPVGPSTIRMDGGSRNPSRRFWRPVLFQLSYVHLLLQLLPEMQKGRSVRLRVLGPDDPWTSASAGAARHVPVLDGTYMGDSSWLGSH